MEKSRFEEVKKELHELLMNEDISHLPILILGNKIDAPGACSEEELKQELLLTSQTTGKGKIPKASLQTRPLEVFMCTFKKKCGYGDGFRWLAQYI